MHHQNHNALFNQHLGNHRIEISSACKKIHDLILRSAKSLQFLHLIHLTSTSPFFINNRDLLSSHRSNSAKERPPSVYLQSGVVVEVDIRSTGTGGRPPFPVVISVLIKFWLFLVANLCFVNLFLRSSSTVFFYSPAAHDIQFPSPLLVSLSAVFAPPQNSVLIQFSPLLHSIHFSVHCSSCFFPLKQLYKVLTKQDPEMAEQ